MFNSVEGEADYDDSDFESESEDKFNFLPSNFCLISNNGQQYGPFGTDPFGRKPVTIQIVNGDVLAQATSSFLYAKGLKFFKSVECFSFYVSNEI